MRGPEVVIAEDDADLRRLLSHGLADEGFETAAVETGAQLLASVARKSPQALVVDVGLPDADGRDVCQALRAQGVQIPILFLTAHDTVADRVAGLNAGGDDYLVKPFDFDELVARLRALLRRAPEGVPAVDSGGLRLDPGAHAAVFGPTTVTLTPTEFRLLGALAARPGQAVRRRELLGAGWPPGAIVHDNTLDVYVARLRRKLRELDGGPAIATVHGVGYRLE